MISQLYFISFCRVTFLLKVTYLINTRKSSFNCRSFKERATTIVVWMARGRLDLVTACCDRVTTATSWGVYIILRTYDTFPTFSLKKIFQPPPFEEFLEINFQFSMVSILHREGCNHQKLSGFNTWLTMLRYQVRSSTWAQFFLVHFCHYYTLIYHFLATTRNNQNA
jgi:hypothetical protein